MFLRPLALLVVAIGLSVAATTGLTAILAAGMLGAFLLASHWLGRGSDPDIITASAKAYINGLNRLEYLKAHPVKASQTL